MPLLETVQTAFLQTGVDSKTLLYAVKANHESWFRETVLTDGGKLRETDGICWLTSSRNAIVPFPQFPEGRAGNALDMLLAECRAQKTEQIALWSLTSVVPPDLDTVLAARGFELGWEPYWMGLELRELKTDCPHPQGLHIALAETADWNVEDLPYYKKEDAAKLQARYCAIPRQTWHFAAWLNGSLAGHSVVHLTTGPLGVAGIYNVGVIPEFRNKGVGRAVTLAACQFAHNLGCHYAVLNSAVNIYERLGFKSLGHGQTWWMHKATLRSPPSAERIAFIEAVGQGDSHALETSSQDARPADLNALLPCGISPMSLAVRTAQATSVKWLIAHGAIFDVIHAWDMGGIERAANLLRENPEFVNRSIGPDQMMPLHIAVERNNLDLARLLLSARPDMEQTDARFQATPLGWARHLNYAAMIELLETQK